MTKPFYLTDEWIKIITETANDYCQGKGYVIKIRDDQTRIVLQALFIAIKTMDAVKTTQKRIKTP